MARETVGLYIRLSSVRTYRKVNPKSKTQPSGTFCLRYKQHGKRIWRTMAGCGTPAGTQCGRRIGETARNDPHVCRRRCDPARYRVDRLERREGLRAGSAVEKLEVNRCSVLHSNKLPPNLFGLWANCPQSEEGVSYQISFNPNCTCRDVVEVLVIAPAVPETPEGVNTIRFGVLKLARFRRLKISARNCRLNRS